MKRSASEDDEKVGKVEPKVPKIEEKKKAAAPPTGRQIIEQYIKGDVAAAVTYRKICNALETLDTWENDAPKLQLLEQFVGMADALELPTETLVTKLLKLRWNKIPSSIMEPFRNFICELAIRQLCFTETVFNSVVARFAPEMAKDAETEANRMVLDDSEQQKQYDMAHYIISNVMRCFPLSAKTLLRSLKNNFPHFTQPAARSGAYIKNLILLQHYAPKTITVDVWRLIFERLAKDDAHNWNCEQNEEDSNTPSLFAMNETVLINDVEEAENTIKSIKREEMYSYLDSTCNSIMTYTSYIHGVKTADHEWISESPYTRDEQIGADTLFEVLVECLETSMLTAIHVHHVSFIWLHLCSLRKEYASRMLEQLWQWLCRMPRAPIDSKKSQGAAAYLAAFVARAKYIDKTEAFYWLEEMFAWLRRYVDQFGSGSSQILPGLQRHGTFYAVSQAFFIVFAFRYCDFAKNTEKLESIRRWGIGRVVHSPLEPLRFVSKPVARCFSAITRSLQLVYCNHVIPIGEVQRPFDDMFPFDSFNLKVSSELVKSLMRKFSPLAEDVSIVTAALSWNAVAAEKEQMDGKTGTSATATASNDLDFLDDDDLIVGFRERSGTCGQSSLINYSATPGLKPFGV